MPTYQRLLGLATAFCAVLTGCGDKGLDKPLPAPSARIQVRAPWKEGARIPARYTCSGADIAPAVSVSAPRGTAQVAWVMSDPDSPGGTFVHWTRWGATSEGTNSFGKRGYAGPCPPKGDRPHHYVLTAYALRRRLGLAPGSDPAAVVAAIKSRAFASGSVTGLYGR